MRKRIKDVETVAADLFAEWEKEIKQISTPSLQAGSRGQLHHSRQVRTGDHRREDGDAVGDRQRGRQR